MIWPLAVYAQVMHLVSCGAGSVLTSAGAPAAHKGGLCPHPVDLASARSGRIKGATSEAGCDALYQACPLDAT